jgi:glycosyltransferase involved in cell wall biosynthesis
MNKLKILAFSDIIPTDTQGGSSTAAWETSKSFVLKGHEVTIITKGIKSKNAAETIDGIEVLRYFSSPVKLFSLTRKYLSLNKPDAVFIHAPLTAIASFFVDRKIPCIYMFYSPWHEEYEIRSPDLHRGYFLNLFGSMTRRLIEHLIMKNSDKIVVNSKFMAEKVTKYHNMNSIVVPLGVDIDRFAPELIDTETKKKKLHIPEKRFIIITVRNLVSRMGIENLITSMKKVSEYFPDIFLIIAGRGFLKEKLEQQIADLGLTSHIRLEGYIPDSVLHEYYQASDLFVLPTKYLEGFGLVTLEAMSCGTPVLATPIAANIEVLGLFDNKMLFKSSQPDDISEGIIRYIPEYIKNKEVIRNRCRQFVEKGFTWNICGDKLMNILDEVIKEI